MEILETVIREMKEVVDITCDCCGKSCKTDYGMENMKLVAHWGFMSNHDLETWTAQICEKCVMEHLAKIINFNIKDNGGFHNDSKNTTSDLPF